MTKIKKWNRVLKDTTTIVQNILLIVLKLIFQMNQYEKNWLKSNIKVVGASYKTKFVNEFR